ncbi:MAG: PGF-pre-PGF domain-containing protein [Candidatus Methanoperedens sp.]|nr:PGF-pre-PGF domain-containing protein [Candidatus Methanoperedens sp.]
MKTDKLLIYSYISLLLMGAGILNASAVTVSINPQDVIEGQTFDARVIIDPQGQTIAGAQTDLEYDFSNIRINNISEGDLFNKDGSSTFFSSGIIDNSLGKAINIYGALLGSANVKTVGTFIIINATALVSTNSANITFTNILVVGPQGDQVYPVPITTNPNQIEDGFITGGAVPVIGGGGSGGGGGGGGNSGENVSNIEVIEKYDLPISRDALTSYRFAHETNPIMFVNITGNTSLGIITTSVEVLKDSSTLMSTRPEGIVYKNANIWVGTSGYATPKNIKEARITFRVLNSWIEANGLSGSDVKMTKWDKNQWIQLETSEKQKNDIYTFYEAKTNRFSPFAIVAAKVPKNIPVLAFEIMDKPAMTQTPSAVSITELPAEPTPIRAGLYFQIAVAIIFILIIVAGVNIMKTRKE